MPESKIGISYSWDGPAHEDWVAKLVAQLRASGLEVVFDQDLELGAGIPEFMERLIRDSSRVLVICTPRYKEKADQRKGGVGYEENIISAEIMKRAGTTKFVPVLRDGDWETAVPTCLAAKLGVGLRGDPYSEKEYARLLSRLQTSVASQSIIEQGRPESAAVARISDTVSTLGPDNRPTLRRPLSFNARAALALAAFALTTPANPRVALNPSSIQHLEAAGLTANGTTTENSVTAAPNRENEA